MYVMFKQTSLPLVCFELEMLFDRSESHVFCCAGARARSVAGEHRQGWGLLKDYGHFEMLVWEKNNLKLRHNP